MERGMFAFMAAEWGRRRTIWTPGLHNAVLNDFACLLWLACGIVQLHNTLPILGWTCTLFTCNQCNAYAHCSFVSDVCGHLLVIFASCSSRSSQRRRYLRAMTSQAPALSICGHAPDHTQLLGHDTNKTFHEVCDGNDMKEIKWNTNLM